MTMFKNEGTFLRNAVPVVVPPTSVLDKIVWDKVNYPITITKNPWSRKFSTNFNRDGYVPDSMFVTTFYVNQTTGLSGNSGLSKAAAKNTISQAYTAGVATGQPFAIEIPPGTYAREKGLNASGTVLPTQSFKIYVEGGGRASITTHTALVWPTSNDATYPNCTIVARASVATVWANGVQFLNARGTARKLTLVTSAALCNSTPFSWFQNGGNLMVNLGVDANGVPIVATDAIVRAFIKGVGSPFATAAGMNGKRFYAKGISFEGGVSVGAVAITSTTVGCIGVFEDCTMAYAGDDTLSGATGAFDATAVAGTGFYAFIRCKAFGATKDAWNGHQTAAGARQTFVLTIDCEGFDVGLNAASNSNNALTIHEQVVWLDVNGYYHHARGGTIRNIDDSRMGLFGTRFGYDTVGGGIDATGCRADDSAEIYGFDCTAIMSLTSEYAASTTNVAKIVMSGFDAGGALVTGVTQMGTDIALAA